jgi:signal transduction histidine kinase
MIGSVPAPPADGWTKTMAAPGSNPQEERVLIFAPMGEDAALTGQVLDQAGFASHACPTLDDLCQEFDAGVGVVLLTGEEALASASLEGLLGVLDRQPPWSGLPLIILTRSGLTTQQVLETLRSSGTLITLERPVPTTTLVSAVRAALQARRRQYEVRDLLQQLESASRQREEFLAMLAHELRNPLAPMSNAVQLLRLRGPQDPTTERVREVVERQVRHMCRLVDDLLDVSRLTRGKIVLHPARVDLGYLVQQTVEDHRGAIADAGLELTLDLPREPVWVSGDSTRLAQVVSNLLHNAVKFTDPGGKIGVRVFRCSGVQDGAAPASDVPNGATRTPEHLDPPFGAVAVRDTGIGIDPDLLPNLFESFTQGDQGLERSRGGLGLGLGLVKKLIELHGGAVRAHSKGRGHGAEFTFRLPLLESEPTSTDDPAGDQRGAGTVEAAREK